jgi:hypothetical protein
MLAPMISPCAMPYTMCPDLGISRIGIDSPWLSKPAHSDGLVPPGWRTHEEQLNNARLKLYNAL